jgi:CHAT domain-containing protein/SIR2-like protein
LAKHADFDVFLRWAGDGRFDVTILFNAPGDIEDYQYFSTQPIQVDLDRLDSLREDVTAYGVELGQLLFSQGASSYLDRALGLAQEMPVHMRLVLNDDTPLRYRTIRWETLRHPLSEVRITTSENIRFCRYLSNPDGTPPSPLSLQNRLAALVVVANPAGIEGHADGLSQLTPVDVDKEVARAKKALEGMSVRVLSEEGKRATAANIVDAIRVREVNVLYLVCHGMLDEDGPALFLENERGAVDKVDGADLAARIGDLKHQVPTLAALVSCQSAGPIDETTAAPGAMVAPEVSEATAESARSLTAFGPALSKAGCAVVVAMQGNISMLTAARFMPKFFKELSRDGIAAHAMAVARSYISDEQDWFVPVLYSRLKRGSAWYLPRFGRQRTARFDNLHTRIAEGNCTPIVGSVVAAEDGLLPTREKVAIDWASRRQIPVRDQAKADLASVAQYVAVDADDRAVARDELAQYLRSYLKKEYGADLPGIDWRRGNLDENIQAVGRFRRKASGGKDCYSRLAELELPIFITSSWTSVLEDALRGAGKEPLTGHFEWYRDPPLSPPLDGEIDIKRPLVYHLFGTVTVPKSLVLTEDDYFSWLRSWMKQVDKGVGIPDEIKPSLMDSSLMFLGYGFDDWEFRMIFQALKGFEGTRELYSRHVGVQFEPGALRIEPEAAQEYLEDYLRADHLDIYWGRCDEFLQELAETRPRYE